jgi:hypothetical protein
MIYRACESVIIDALTSKTCGEATYISTATFSSKWEWGELKEVEQKGRGTKEGRKIRYLKNARVEESEN